MKVGETGEHYTAQLEAHRTLKTEEERKEKTMTMEERIKNHVCCFCESELEHTEGQNPETWGNNPDNACSWEDARCCNSCNWKIVLPVREFTSRIIH